MTGGEDHAAADGANADLKTMHEALIGLAARLDEALDAAPDLAAVTAITREKTDVAVRITRIGAILLVRQTDEITELARTVSAATPGIEREIEDLDKWEKTVRGIAAVLDAVDTAVALAAKA